MYMRATNTRMRNTNNTTIWESASRPLFVRSVWLEAENVRGIHQRRHFILDYEHKTQEQRVPTTKSYRSIQSRARSDPLQYATTACCDYTHCDSVGLQSAHDSTDDLFLVGSAKVKLHQPLTLQHYKQQQQKSCKNRRSRAISRKQHSYESYYNKRLPFWQDLLSRRSSLQEMSQLAAGTNGCAEDRLAERVLNWLDLAGKTDLLKTREDSQELTVENIKPSKQEKQQKAPTTTAVQRWSNQRGATAQSRAENSTSYIFSNRRHSSVTQQRNNHQASNNSTSTSTHSCHKHDSMKHITIIFNRDGIPVRFNRPARNIDLCALSASAETARRLAGPLASARLYKPSEYNSTTTIAPQTTTTASNKPQTAHSGMRRRLERNDGGGDIGRNRSAPTRRRTQDESSHVMRGAAGGLQNDAKKQQLHIFMPSLPKKGLQGKNGEDMSSCLTTEETVSVLSNTISDLKCE